MSSGGWFRPLLYLLGFDAPQQLDGRLIVARLFSEESGRP
jgi:hypothetical protein